MKEWKNWRIKRKKGGEKDNEKDETEREHKRGNIENCRGWRVDV